MVDLNYDLESGALDRIGKLVMAGKNVGTYPGVSTSTFV